MVVDPPRTCLHCALARALRAEADALAAAGLAIRLGRSEPVWLPASGQRLYRAIRRLLRTARLRAEHGPVKLAVVDLVGKPDVEVTAAVPVGCDARVLRVAFPRHVPAALPGGFAEGVAS
ncbi:MAG: hypothetical protein KIT14_21535 [bacterium]|nr:hypothetical protein [bacterium]